MTQVDPWSMVHPSLLPVEFPVDLHLQMAPIFICRKYNLLFCYLQYFLTGHINSIKEENGKEYVTILLRSNSNLSSNYINLFKLELLFNISSKWCESFCNVLDSTVNDTIRALNRNKKKHVYIKCDQLCDLCIRSVVFSVH